MSRTNVNISVISDLNTDQRVQKIATTLQLEFGNVTVLCRSSTNESPIFPFNVVRIAILFKKGPLFYAEYNIRLFLKLLFSKADVFVSNDVDTLLPNYYAAKLRRKKVVFDAHEIMSEVPELVNRPRIKRIWQWIERRYIPKIEHKYTVCTALQNHYNSNFRVVRNVPYKLGSNNAAKPKQGKKIILYQGSINMGRGIETMINAMPYLDDCEFWIVGNGYQLDSIKNLVQKLKVEHRVILKGSLLPEQLKDITPLAHLGISIEENLGLNYYYALPNKLMDYIQHSVPVLVSNFPEMAAIINSYNVGETLNSREPKLLATQVKRMLGDDKLNAEWQKNLKHAADELCWENEKKILLEVFSKLL